MHQASIRKSNKKAFKELPYYEISIKYPCIKCLNNFDMLREVPFYDELNTVKESKAFKK